MDSRQMRAAADANFAASFRKLVQYGPDADSRDFGGVLAFISGLPIGLFNGSVGSAATWAAIAEGRRWGCDLAVLQSSEMAESIYGSMGFRTIVRYLEFRSPLP